MIVATGTPEQVAANPASHTGQFLKPLLDAKRVAMATRADRLEPASAARKAPSSKPPAKSKKPAKVPAKSPAKADGADAAKAARSKSRVKDAATRSVGKRRG